MRNKLIILIICIVVILIQFIIRYPRFFYPESKKPWVSRILLKTTPLNSKDIFRGDYVQLKYEISTLNLNKLNANDNFTENEKIYVILEEDSDGTYKAVAVSKGPERPERSKKFIQGTIINIMPKHNIDVEYGIESHFVEEGKGKVIETARSGANLKVQVDLYPNGRSEIVRLFTEVKNGLIEIK
jgi:uncharacterized membrane-anchored protein